MVVKYYFLVVKNVVNVEHIPASEWDMDVLAQASAVFTCRLDARDGLPKWVIGPLLRSLNELMLSQWLYCTLRIRLIMRHELFDLGFGRGPKPLFVPKNDLVAVPGILVIFL